MSSLANVAGNVALEVVSTTLDSLERIGEEMQRLNERMRAERKAALQPFLDALAASGEVSVIAITGYTPAFNDGEPCTHTAEYYVNVKECFEQDLLRPDVIPGLPDEICDGLKPVGGYDSRLCRWVDYPEAEEENAELCRKFGHVYAPPSREIDAAIRDLVFAAAEDEHTTNYCVSYILKDGKFEEHSGSYDCGY